MPLTEEEKKIRKKERNRLWYENNKEQILKRVNEYSKNNREKILEGKKKQYQNRKYSDNHIKQQRKGNWKKRGLDITNFEEIYERYIKSEICEICSKEYTKKNPKCMEHNHTTGQCRFICCKDCNNKIYSTDCKFEKVLKSFLSI